MATNRDVPIIGSVMASAADVLFVLYQLSLQLAQRADISTNLAHAKIILFNAWPEAC